MQLIIMKESRGIHNKGDIVEVRATGAPFAGKEPEVFVMIEVPDLPMTDFKDKAIAWKRDVDFEVVAQNESIDGFRIRLFAANANSGLGAVTREQAEGFIQNWNGAVQSFGTNEVTFDITIYDALVSQGFWDIDLDARPIVFSEVSYNLDTGIHRIAVDYNGSGINNTTYVEQWVSGKGLTIVTHSAKVLTYDADRSIVRNVFQDDLKEKLRETITRRRYYVGSGVVDYIVGQGGTATTDRATLESYIKDKMTE